MAIRHETKTFLKQNYSSKTKTYFLPLHASDFELKLRMDFDKMFYWELNSNVRYTLYFGFESV